LLTETRRVLWSIANRQGKVHIGAYLPADFKRGIRLLQATTGETLQSIMERMFNEQFRRQGQDQPGDTQISWLWADLSGLLLDGGKSVHG